MKKSGVHKSCVWSCECITMWLYFSRNVYWCECPRILPLDYHFQELDAISILCMDRKAEFSCNDKESFYRLSVNTFSILNIAGFTLIVILLPWQKGISVRLWLCAMIWYISNGVYSIHKRPIQVIWQLFPVSDYSLLTWYILVWKCSWSTKCYQ